MLTMSVEHKIRKRSDYLVCYDKGHRYYSKHFVLFVLIHDPLCSPWRLGLAVSKKIGNAVVRNRVKRVLRNFFRLHQDLLSSDTDFVVVPKRHLNVNHVNLNFVTNELKPILVNCCERCVKHN